MLIFSIAKYCAKKYADECFRRYIVGNMALRVIRQIQKADVPVLVYPATMAIGSALRVANVFFGNRHTPISIKFIKQSFVVATLCKQTC